MINVRINGTNKLLLIQNYQDKTLYLRYQIIILGDSMENKNIVGRTCPKCGSKNSYWRTQKQEYHCGRCGFDWHAGEMLTGPDLVAWNIEYMNNLRNVVRFIAGADEKIVIDCDASEDIKMLAAVAQFAKAYGDKVGLSEPQERKVLDATFHRDDVMLLKGFQHVKDIELQLRIAALNSEPLPVEKQEKVPAQ
jgi:ribosomal protein S27AE